jgi:uncharacterized protein YwqG
MSASGEERDELSRLSATELAQAYVKSVEAEEATEHIGRQNRLARHRRNIVEALKTRGEALQVLERLAEHSNGQVRANAKGALDRLDKPAQEFAPEPLRWPQILWQCDHPPPAALTRDEIAERLRRSVPASRDRLMDLTLPAIGLWPQRRADIPAAASRFGGTPLAPPDWEWPTFEDEPMLFVGQIDCAELRGLPGAELLPPHGVLAFFGDHDAVQGCDSLGMSAVYHWPGVDRFVAAQPPIDPILIFPACAMAPRPILDLPHPFSHAVSKLQLGKEEREAYFDAWLEIREHGIPRECVDYAGFSKLLGWPHLLQNDLWRFESQDDARLLLQVDSYCNGETLHGWGTGGSLYYLLPERDLRARFYDNCEFEGQFT